MKGGNATKCLARGLALTKQGIMIDLNITASSQVWYSLQGELKCLLFFFPLKPPQSVFPKLNQWSGEGHKY